MDIRIIRKRVKNHPKDQTFTESWIIKEFSENRDITKILENLTKEQVIDYLTKIGKFKYIELMFDSNFTDMEGDASEVADVLLSPSHIDELNIQSWMPPNGDWSYLVKSDKIVSLIASNAGLKGLKNLSQLLIGGDHIYKKKRLKYD